MRRRSPTRCPCLSRSSPSWFFRWTWAGSRLCWPGSRWEVRYCAGWRGHPGLTPQPPARRPPGPIAGTFARTYPSRVRRLLLVAPAGLRVHKPLLGRLAEQPLVGEVALPLLGKGVLSSHLNAAFFRPDAPGVKEEIEVCAENRRPPGRTSFPLCGLAGGPALQRPDGRRPPRLLSLAALHHAALSAGRGGGGVCGSRRLGHSHPRGLGQAGSSRSHGQQVSCGMATALRGRRAGRRPSRRSRLTVPRPRSLCGPHGPPRQPTTRRATAACSIRILRPVRPRAAGGGRRGVYGRLACLRPRRRRAAVGPELRAC